MNYKHAIRRNFARRGATYDRHAGVQRWMAAALVKDCREDLGQAQRILEVGCGTGYLTELIWQTNPEATLVAIDLDPSLLHLARSRLGGASQVHFVAADGEAFGGGPFDLIIANAVFQWFSRPADTLGDYGRMLRRGGCLAFATLGPATFWELAAALKEAADRLDWPQAPAIMAQNFRDASTWQSLLSQTGFADIRVRREVIIETHPTVPAFLRHLQATGATNPVPLALPPRLFRQLVASYREAFLMNDVIPVSYEVIQGLARK